MGFYIGLGLLAVLFVWLIGIGKAGRAVAPEDDITTRIDTGELADAERDVRNDPAAMPIQEAVDDPDDWGPGTPGSGGNRLPGVL
ncbi:MAG: hypothetical protein H0W15_07920 [Gemmatimonadales bacterium]|nr:hypothetical protein [Gemmatimonadales bacterium]